MAKHSFKQKSLQKPFEKNYSHQRPQQLYTISQTRSRQVCEPEHGDKVDMDSETIPKDIKTLSTTLCDQLSDLHSLHSFFYIVVEILLKNEKLLDEESLHGLWLNMCWLQQQSEQAKASAGFLHKAITD